MTHQRLKILFSISSVLITVAMFLLYQAVPYLGSIYLAMLKGVEDSLPVLTSEFALPMLRVNPSVPLQYPTTLWWVSIIWGLVIIAPVLAIFWSRNTTDFKEFLTRWLGTMFIYFPVVLILFTVIMSGLFIAIAPFPDVVIR